MRIIKRILRILKTKPEKTIVPSGYTPRSITGKPLLDNLSPIPRHNLESFDKLVYGEDLNKNSNPKHPNPKFDAADIMSNLSFDDTSE